MNAALPGFTPLRTLHCVTGSMRHIYEYHHYPISEDLLLGLGAGIGFVYWHQKGGLPFLGGRGNVGRPGEEGLEKTAGKRTGVSVQSFESGSARRAEKALLDLLAAGEPVMLYVDMAFLPYFDLPEGYHFGGHAVVAAGYDAKAENILIADREGVLHPVALEVLAAARGSKFQPFPPKNRWLTFDFSRQREIRADEVWEAVREASQTMLNPPIANLGVKGIQTAAQRVTKWADVMTESEMRDACINSEIMIDAKGGTGGGLFRYMYGRFLQEAAYLTGDYSLMELGADMILIGDEWQNAAALFAQAAAADNPAPLLNDICYLLETISRLEQALWTTLTEHTAQPVG
jgi:hypothetical protein